MPWLLDGSNLAGGGDRSVVRQAVLALARRERVRLIVFFDGAPPPGVSAVEQLGRVEIRYVPNADQAIAALLSRGGRGWLVATDDRALQARVQAGGARAVPAAGFWRRARQESREAGQDRPAAIDVRAEENFFADADNRLPDAPRRVARSRLKKGHQGRR
jgi:predicted RNA-binding protein with PIN domain